MKYKKHKLKTKIFLHFLVCVFSFFFLVFPFASQAQDNQLANFVENMPLVNAPLVKIVFDIIRYLLGFLGVVAVVILIYGGFLWMTARGNEEQVVKAKKTLINGLIGLIIIMLSFAIVTFVSGKITEISQPPGPICTAGECCANCYRCASDGSACNVWDTNCGINCELPPTPSQFMHLIDNSPTGTGAILCWVVQANFDEDLDCNTVISSNIKLKIKNGAANGANCSTNKDCASGVCSGTPLTCQGNQVLGTFDCSANSFSFDPTNDYEEFTIYEVEITAGLLSNTTPAKSLLPSQRKWEFTTGNQGDSTPPTVLRVYPEAGSTGVCRLAPIQAIFSEVMLGPSLCRVNDNDPTKNSLNLNTVPSSLPYLDFNCRVESLDSFSAQPKSEYIGNQLYEAALNSSIIKDACGLPLAAYPPWQFTTHPTNTLCIPHIDNITGDPYYDEESPGQEFTIEGTDFTLTGNVRFSQNLSLSHTSTKCFDSDHLPNQPCFISWSGNRIQFQIPAANGDSNGAVTGPIWVRVNNSYSNSWSTFSILSPHIESFSPNNGGVGQGVTIYGKNFGSTASSVGFVKVSPYSWTLAVLPCGASGWQDDKIIIKVPNNLSGIYYLQVKDSGNHYSNIVEFQVNTNPAGPILCDITHHCPGTTIIGGKKDDVKTLTGDGFGLASLTSKVFFNGTAVLTTSWSNTSISLNVPNLSPKTYSVKVKLDTGLPNERESNPLNFISPCQPIVFYGGVCTLDPPPSLSCKADDVCQTPFQCVEGTTECRCCCENNSGCPTTAPNCDTNQTCGPSTSNVKGVCCGCANSNACALNQVCKEKISGNPCCYTCEIGDDTPTPKSCHGGECCTRSCAEFTTPLACQAQQGCNWTGTPPTCQGTHSPYCCPGRCVNHQCLNLCGNGVKNYGEQCDPGALSACDGLSQINCQAKKGCELTGTVCQTKVDLNGKTCATLGLGFVGGTLACNPDCTFDTTGCSPPGGPGHWGDVCRNTALGCTSGAVSCPLAEGAACVQNVTTPPLPPCACCCRPDDLITLTTEETCLHNLTCDITKNCSYTSPPQKGLCCGCGGPTGDDDGKCCGTPGQDCNGFACKNNCCVPFPAPTNLEVIDPTIAQIKLRWQYSDPENLATHFEIYKKDPIDVGFSFLTTCKITAPYECHPYCGSIDNTADCTDNDLCEWVTAPTPICRAKDYCSTLILNPALNGTTCQANTLCEWNNTANKCQPKFFVLKSPSANLYNFEDNRGGFTRNAIYSYKVRAKKGTSTAYSDYTDEALGIPTGVVSCDNNDDCPNIAPCCDKNTHQCITVDLCNFVAGGNCDQVGACQLPEAKFALADFLVDTSLGAIPGPCLLKVEPTSGYRGITKVKLTGKDFGDFLPPPLPLNTTGVVFYNDQLQQTCSSWIDTEIEDVPVHSNADFGSHPLQVKKDNKLSNGLTFTVLKTTGPPGAECKEETISACNLGFDTCQTPTIYSCRPKKICWKPAVPSATCPPPCSSGQICISGQCFVSTTQFCSYDTDCATLAANAVCLEKDDCLCCCQPDNPTTRPNENTCQNNLRCIPKDPCKEGDRGLCCGCQNDTQCTGQGCGFLDPNRCCYPSPSWQGTSFCEDPDLYEVDAIPPTDVHLNTDITLTFDKKMDFSRLNENYIKISREGTPEFTDECQPIGDRCYLYHQDIRSQNIPTAAPTQTQTIFSSRRCKLQKNTEYKIEIVVGKNGEGVRSEKGVSLGTSGASICSWDNTKKCLSQTFKTADNEEALCKIEWIDVQPREVVVREQNIGTPFNAYAWDSSNPPHSVCVKNFEWESSNTGVATVTTPGLSTTASSQGFGEALIIASIPNCTPTTSPKCICVKTPETDRTCGKLRVSLAGPQVIEQESCETCNLGGQSPSPRKIDSDWQDSDLACLKAQVVAKFNREMNSSSLTTISGNILIHQCGTGDFNDMQCPEFLDLTSAITNSISGTLTMILGDYNEDDIQNPIGFYFKPSSVLTSEKIYRVTLRSGSTGITDIHGRELDGDKNGIQDGSPVDNYVWYFKTSTTATCPLNKVCVYSPSAKITHSATQTFQGEIYTANCNYLEPSDYTWTWTRQVVESYPIPTSGSVVSRLKKNGETCLVNSDCESNSCISLPLSPIKICTGPGSLPSYQARFRSTNLGQVDIKGAAGGKEDQARLIVATKPTVEIKYPHCNNFTTSTTCQVQLGCTWTAGVCIGDIENICRNTAIYAIFDQETDQNSFTNNFLITGETTGNLTDRFLLRFEKVGSKTKVLFVPNEPLTGNEEYTILIKKEIKSIVPFSEEMPQNFSWLFTTGSQICLLDRVVVDADPSTIYNPITGAGLENKMPFNKIEGKPFKAYSLARDGQEISPVTGSYEWTWSWKSNETSVATVTNTDNPTQTVAAQPKNGLATITAMATITSNLPNILGGTKSGSALADIWLCENPWPCVGFPNCLPYEDKTATTTCPGETNPRGTTNFEFRYCRDAGPPGIEGDLPILRGNIVCGAAEPNKLKEHLFSVLDGSLSIYYRDGITNASGTKTTNFSGYNNDDYNLYFNNGDVIGGIGPASDDPFTGSSGKSFSFSGMALSYIQVAQNITLESQNLTLATWVKDGTDKHLFRKGSNEGYSLKIDNNKKIHFWIFDRNNTKQELALTNVDDPQIDSSLWTHVAATYDGQKLKIYINGVLKGEKSAPGGIKYSGTEPLKIGDGGLLLDEIALYARALSQPEIEELTKAPVKVSLGDVVGFKVFSNFDHLRPSEWFFKKFNQSCGGAPSVDGYQSCSVGRTTYVGATNIYNPTTDNKIFSNIYLVSHNDNAKSETLQIFQKIIENWKFNINVSDPNVITPENENKIYLSRDLERIYHLNNIAPLFEKYKNEKGSYPKLESGSYIVGMTTSKWPSWNKDPAFNLAKELNGSLPVDPINKFANFSTPCGTAPNQYSCCADCLSGDPQCGETCYNSARKTCSITTNRICSRDSDCPVGETCKSSPIYKCNSGSHVYQYKVEDEGKLYGFYSRFEYSSDPNKWQHGCEIICSGLNQTNCQKKVGCRWDTSCKQDENFCQSRHWCEWTCGDSGLDCYNKVLNYQSNPCSSPSTCQCFNSKYKPSVHRPSNYSCPLS